MILQIVALAGGISLALTPLMLSLLRRLDVVDVPGPRSSHDLAVPRGLGIAVAVAAVAAVMAARLQASPGLSALLVFSISMVLIGAAEDLRGVPVAIRLTIQFIAAAAILPWLAADLSGPVVWQWVFTAGAAIWVVAYANAFNFMDGINGISSVQAIVAGITYGVIGTTQDLALLEVGGYSLAAAVAGFAPFNFPRAKGFLGDSGSYFIGGWIAVLTIIGVRAGAPFPAMIAPVVLYCADTAWTLMKRLRERERIHEPHRRHVYQQMVQAGWSHTRTTLVVGSFIGLMSLIGMTTTIASSTLLEVLASATIAALVVGYLAAPRFIRPSVIDS